MRVSFLTLTLPALVAAFVLATPGRPDDPAPENPARIDLGGSCIWNTVVGGDHLYGLNYDRVRAVDLKQRKVRDIFQTPQRLEPFLAVEGKLGCVASRGRLHVIDLAAGQEVCSAEFPGDVRGLGFAGPGRAFVRGDRTVTVFDAKTGKLLHTIDLGGQKPPGESPSPSAQDVDGARLFIGSPDLGGLVVADLERGEVAERLPMRDWRPEAVRVAGGRAFMAGARLSYGIWINGLVAIDLKTKEVKHLALPAENLKRPCALLSGPGGTVILTCDDTAHQYDAEGKLLGGFGPPKRGRLAGFWNGQAVLDCIDRVELMTAARPEPGDPWVGNYIAVGLHPAQASEVAITRDGDGYRLSSFPDRKFVEAEKGVTLVVKEDGRTGLDRISTGTAHFPASREKQVVILKAEFCYAEFYLIRK